MVDAMFLCHDNNLSLLKFSECEDIIKEKKIYIIFCYKKKVSIFPISALWAESGKGG